MNEANIQIHFSIKHNAESKQYMCVFGNCTELGAWNPGNAIKLLWNEVHNPASLILVIYPAAGSFLPLFISSERGAGVQEQPRRAQARISD